MFLFFMSKYSVHFIKYIQGKEVVLFFPDKFISRQVFILPNFLFFILNETKGNETKSEMEQDWNESKPVEFCWFCQVIEHQYRRIVFFSAI